MSIHRMTREGPDDDRIVGRGLNDEWSAKVNRKGKHSAKPDPGHGRPCQDSRYQEPFSEAIGDRRYPRSHTRLGQTPWRPAARASGADFGRRDAGLPAGP